MKPVLAPQKLSQIARQVETIVATTPVDDIHTHLYDPAFGDLLLWGIDDLLVYHYLVSESFRYLDLPYDKFWALSKTEQANLVWDQLFLRHSPISEACRGILTTLNLLGLDVKKRDLNSVRQWFAAKKPERYVDRCFELAGLRSVCMTNSPFDDLERPTWEKGFRRDSRFKAALRIDALLLTWPQVAPQLVKWGYDVSASSSPKKTFDEVRRFFADWTKRMNAGFLMVSLPPDFAYPSKSITSELIEKAVLPHCREFNLPFAIMPGVKRAVNPQLRLSGDGVGLSNLTTIQNLCAQHPDNKFAATVLARENQHELCVLARKFRNLHIFGCWWFTNVPSLIEEMTRMRIELLGLSVTPQHSDARVLDQVIYKWTHSRKVIAKVLMEKYSDLAATGWVVTKAEMERDVRDLFGGAFESFCQR